MNDSLSCGGDHPRTRGVYRRYTVRQGSAQGSSPHTRGLPVRLGRGRPGGRIIPAHAGFTGSPSPPRSGAPDHPRTRGVYCVPLRHPLCKRGSSPHTRGLLSGCVLSCGAPRIIPAHAGFTVYLSLVGVCWGDHPRTRGVYMKSTQNHLTLAGSSPHTRGLLCALTPSPMQEGIIPAHAGFTERLRTELRRAQDHPRTRGVYGLPKFGGGVLGGSSPHTRGLRRRVWPCGG